MGKAIYRDIADCTNSLTGQIANALGQHTPPQTPITLLSQ